MKKIIFITITIISATLIFYACSKERDHANPFDPGYWESDKVQPSNLFVEHVNLTTAKISWIDNSVEDNFIIERKHTDDSNWVEVNHIVGDYSTSVKKYFLDTGIEIGFEYSYRLYSKNDNAESDFIESSPYLSFPNPTNLSATVLSQTSVKLSWTDNSIGEDGFTIQKKLSSSDLWTNVANVDSNLTYWTDTELSSNNSYDFRISAYYSVYYSKFSNECICTTSNEYTDERFISQPIGSFSMGQDGIEVPVHIVNITRPYFLGKYEITQKEWRDIIGSNPSNGYGLGDNYPVYYVNWYSIIVYCNSRSINEKLTPCYKINGSTNPSLWGDIPTYNNSLWNKVTCDFNVNGYRLPTEAEWEYAARYNDGRTYSWGNAPPSSSLCNYNSNVGLTTAVGSYPSGNSYLGLCDMTGNVWEWVWDWYQPYSESEQTDPTGHTSETYRILRGGSGSETERYIRCAYRNIDNPSNKYHNCGFRLAKTK